jgi:hypothetical protein
MPIVFVIARDWVLRTMVRAELRDKRIDAVGMDSAAEAGVRIASGIIPSVVVMEASGEVDPALESLARHVPFVVVSSAFDSDVWPVHAAARLLRRPVRVAEVIAAVLELLRGQPA